MKKMKNKKQSKLIYGDRNQNMCYLGSGWDRLTGKGHFWVMEKISILIRVVVRRG